MAAESSSAILVGYILFESRLQFTGFQIGQKRLFRTVLMVIYTCFHYKTLQKTKTEPQNYGMEDHFPREMAIVGFHLCFQRCILEFPTTKTQLSVGIYGILKNELSTYTHISIGQNSNWVPKIRRVQNAKNHQMFWSTGFYMLTNS